MQAFGEINALFPGIMGAQTPWGPPYWVRGYDLLQIPKGYKSKKGGKDQELIPRFQNLPPMDHTSHTLRDQLEERSSYGTKRERKT